jgi:NMD protein affecting ribosome stability and mRNA decay
MDLCIFCGKEFPYSLHQFLCPDCQYKHNRNGELANTQAARDRYVEDCERLRKAWKIDNQFAHLSKGLRLFWSLPPDEQEKVRNFVNVSLARDADTDD